MKRLSLSILQLFIALVAFSQSCLPDGIAFSTQAAIDNFQTNYPGCTEIEGAVTVSGTDINNLNGLSVITAIGGNLIIDNNENLEDLSGLANLYSVGGTLEIRRNDVLINLSGLSSLSSIDGPLVIGNNHNLMSIDGLGNINAGSISDMAIFSNFSLTDCEIQNICEYLSNPGGIVQICFNAPGCASAIELSISCGITSPCLPYGRYFCQSQEDIDNFNLVYPGCTELEGLLSVSGFDINNLEGISAVTSIDGSLFILKCASILNLTDLANLVNVGETIMIQDNESLENLEGLEGLTSVPFHLDIDRNQNLVSLSGLGNINNVGTLLINDNPILKDLNGLSNLNTIEEDFALTGNSSLKELSGLSNLKSIKRDILIDFNNDLKSLSGLDNLNASMINSLYIHHNDSLSDCAIESICDFLINTNGYSYIEYNAHHCANEEVVINFCTVGSAQLPDIDHYIIYPNPATNYIIFKNDSPSANYLYLTISDLKGRQIIREKADANVNLINVTQLPSGIYYVKIIGDQTVFVEKIIKE